MAERIRPDEHWGAADEVAQILCLSTHRVANALHSTQIHRVVRRKSRIPGVDTNCRWAGILWSLDDARELMRIRRETQLSLSGAVRVILAKQRGVL